VTLDDRGVPAAFEHRMAVPDICGRDIPGKDPNGWTLDKAEVGPDLAGSRSMTLNLHTDDRRCPPRSLLLSNGDFQPVEPEVHPIRKPTGTAAVDDPNLLTPPKKKK